MWTLQQNKTTTTKKTGADVNIFSMIYVYHYATIITQFKLFGRNSFFMLTICEKVCKYSKLLFCYDYIWKFDTFEDTRLDFQEGSPLLKQLTFSKVKNL